MTAPTITGTPQVGQTLTASIGDIHPPVAYQWNSAGKPISGATSATYVPFAADVGHKITLTVATVSPPTAAIIDIIPTNSVIPTISGTARVGDVLTATTGTWTHSPTGYASQWANSSIGLIPGATGLTYVPKAADVGFEIAVFVVAANSGGTSAVAESALTGAVLPAIPVNTAVPAISGIAQIGQTLSASTGGWTNSPTSFAYQWSDSATGPIGGATASAYVPTSANLGHTLTVSVVATNAGGPSTPATSAATGAVIDVIPTIKTPASIPGTPHVGNPIAAIDAVWNHSVTSVAYQWKSAGANATGPGATTLTYTPVVGDVGNTLTLTVTATNSGGTSAPSTSATSAAVVAPAVPALLVATLFAATLPSVNNDWVGWQSRDVIPSGNLANPGFSKGLIQVAFSLAAGSSNGTLVGADIGNLGSTNAISFDGNQVPLTFSGSTTIAGLGPGTFSSDAIPFTVNFSAGIVIASSWGGGAVNASWDPSGIAGNFQADSHTITDQTATTPANYPGGFNLHANADAFVTGVSFTGAPFITGTAQAGQTLTANSGTWTNSPTSFTYQWNRAGAPISGATSIAYVPVSADIGNTLTVSVVAINGGGSSSPATSAPTGTVAAAAGRGILDFSQASNSGLISAIAA